MYFDKIEGNANAQEHHHHHPNPFQRPPWTRRTHLGPHPNQAQIAIMSSPPSMKRSHSSVAAPMEGIVKTEDTGDPLCHASLIDASDRIVPYPLSANEPQAITQMPTAPYPNADKEDKTPNDFRTIDQQHNFAPYVRAYYATETTMLAAAKSSLAVASAMKKLNAAHQKTQGWNLSDMQAALEKAEREVVDQSQPLPAESCECVFDAYLKTLKVITKYTNHTGKPAKVDVSLAMHDGVRPVDSWVSIDGYKDEREFMPNKKAEQECKALNATANKGAARQIVNKFAFAQGDIKVPAFAPGKGSNRGPATFTVTFVVAFEGVDEKALRLPEEKGKPAREVSDFALLVPPSFDGRVVPFTLRLPASQGEEERMLPSRQAAKLDAERRGMPTYWLGGTTDEAKVVFRGPFAQPPCLRWRTVTEAFSLDFELEALGGLAINQQEQIVANVRNWVPFSKTRALFEVHLESKRFVVGELGASTPKTHHIIICVDISGSMYMVCEGNSRSNRLIAFAELRKACEKLQDLPGNLVKGRIVGPNDTFVLTIVRFHHQAHTVCPRIALCTASTKREIEDALTRLENCNDSGGTDFTPAVLELKQHVLPTDFVSSLVITDGAIFDQHSFVPAFKELQGKAKAWHSSALGCGAWANYATACLIGTFDKALLDKFDPMVASTALKMIGRSIADHATSLNIAVKSQVLTQWGKGATPELVYKGTAESCTGVDDVFTNLDMGLGATRCFTVCGYFDADSGAKGIPSIVRVDGLLNEHPIPVVWSGASRSANGVLRVIDPLFCPKGIKKLKVSATLGVHEKVIEDIGVEQQCTTSQTSVRTKFHFQEGDDNSIDADVHAEVPELTEAATKYAPIDWLQPYSSHHPSVDVASYGGGLSGGLSGGCSGGAAFRSLSASGAEPEPKFRSCGTDDDSAPTPVSAEVEVEDAAPADPNGVPSFEGMARMFGNQALRGYLVDPKLAHKAAEDIVATLKKVVSGLCNLPENKESGGKGGDSVEPMDLDALLEATAGPTLKDLAAQLPMLLSVLNAFVLRYHVAKHYHELLFHVGDCGEHPVSAEVALLRAKHMLKFAEQLESKLADN